MNRTTILTAAILAFSCCGYGCRRDAAHPDGAVGDAHSLTLALNWFPEAEHGGFFAAQVHGFFEQEGLGVEIRPGGPAAPVIQQVATGRVDFAVANADQVLLGRDQGAPVVAVMTSMLNSPRCIMVHEKSGFDSLLKLRGITLAVGSGKPFARYLLSKLGDAELTIIPYQGNVALFLERDDFAQQAYVFSEPYLAKRKGSDPKCLMISEIGFNPYTSLLITSERMIAEHPEVVGKMVRACRRGWQKYLEEPQRTNQEIHDQNAEMTLDVLAYGAETIRPLCWPAGTGVDRLGVMAPERWRTLAEQLGDIGLLNDPGVWKGAFVERFLNTEEVVE